MSSRLSSAEEFVRDRTCRSQAVCQGSGRFHSPGAPERTATHDATTPPHPGSRLRARGRRIHALKGGERQQSCLLLMVMLTARVRAAQPMTSFSPHIIHYNRCRLTPRLFYASEMRMFSLGAPSYRGTASSGYLKKP